jgi:UDP-glucuronate 4-epimerase
MKILVTGTAGFIGSHLAIKLLEQGHEVTGIDSINSYYSTDLKFARLKEAGISEEAIKWNKRVSGKRYPGYSFIRMNLESKKELTTLFEHEQFDMVCNLAAQAGVRYSLENPDAYISSNIVGFMNILEACRNYNIKHLVYASSSSVYGNSKKMPLSVSDTVDNPVSLYAATKKSNELMAHTYSHLYGIPTTGLRFFTAYGPWGRPDMAYFLFTKAIIEGTPIQVFNNGDLYRDFTYIDDIVDGIINVLNGIPDNEPPYRIYNIGNSSPVKLLDFIETIEKTLGKKAVKNFKEMQPGDVYKTFADVSDLEKDFNYFPDTPIEEGINRFIQWYLKYYKVEIRNQLRVQG